MREELDIEKLKEFKSTGVPFMEFRRPDGDDFYAYTLLANGEPYTHENVQYDRKEIHGLIKIVNLLPEGVAVPRLKKKVKEYVEIDKEYKVRWDRHSVLGREIKKHEPIMGKKFQIMNRGSRPKISGPGTYFDYVVIPIVSAVPKHAVLEMHTHQLLSLETVEPEGEDEER